MSAFVELLGSGELFVSPLLHLGSSSQQAPAVKPTAVHLSFAVREKSSDSEPEFSAVKILPGQTFQDFFAQNCDEGFKSKTVIKVNT